MRKKISIGYRHKYSFNLKIYNSTSEICIEIKRNKNKKKEGRIEKIELNLNWTEYGLDKTKLKFGFIFINKRRIQKENNEMVTRMGNEFA